MLHALFDAFGENPRLGWVAGAALLGISVALALGVAARRRWTRSQQLQAAHAPERTLELCAALVPLVPLLTTVLVLEETRAAILRGVRAPELTVDPDTLFARAMQQSLSAAAVGSIGVGFTLLLAGVAIGFSATARMRASALRRGTSVPNVAIVLAIVLGSLALAFGPVGTAAIVGSLELLDSWAGLVRLGPSAQAAHWDAALRAGRAVLDAGLLGSVAGTLVAALALAVFWLGRAPALPVRTSLAIAAVALALAALLAGLAGPMRSENAAEWPGGSRAGLGFSAATPQLEGPDAVEFGPLVELTRDSLAVDRNPVGMEQLEQRLRDRSVEFRLLHPSERFTGSVRVACEADTPAERLAPAMRALARAGYRAPTFVFDVPVEIDRPALGQVILRRVTGARATLVDAASPARARTVSIQLAESTCMDLSERIVAARRGASEVALFVAHQPGQK